MTKFIKIRGARENNLKNIDLDIPLNKISCFIGPSGSGKSSLAFKTIYKESQRRFINSMSNSARFFNEKIRPVDVDSIEPVLPAFALAQHNPIMGARSCVSDVMGLTHLLQKFFTHSQVYFCPNHKIELEESNLMEEWINQLDKAQEKIHLFISRKDYIHFYGVSIAPSRSMNSKGVIKPFEPMDPYREVLRIKKGKYDSLIKFINENPKFKEFKIFLLNQESEILSLKGHQSWKCPQSDFEVKNKVHGSFFSPYNAIGACSKCKGHGRILVWDETKFMNDDETYENGVKAFQYKRFQPLEKSFLAECEKKKFNKTKPIKELNSDFKSLVWEGSGKYKGLNHYLKLLEKKRYKAAVRIFIRKLQKEIICSTCDGSRLDKITRGVSLKHPELIDLKQIMLMDIKNFSEWLGRFDLKIVNSFELKMFQQLDSLLKVIIGMGLGHLKLNRQTKTLSSGEYQRLLLIKFLAFEGADTLFILDEPSLGLSETEQTYLYEGLKKLIGLGNTILIVEHSDFLIKKSDKIFSLGPMSGAEGGELVPVSTKKLRVLKKEKREIDSFIEVKSPMAFNKTYSDFKIPYLAFTWVNGSSGSGKTSCLVNIMANYFYEKINDDLIVKPKGSFESICAPLEFSNVCVINSQLNRFTSRSSVGSYTKLSDNVRSCFSSNPMAKSLGLEKGHFSSNSKLGQCDECEGKGKTIIEMQYLEDIELVCESCNGMKLKKRYAEFQVGKMNAFEAFNRPMHEILPSINLTPKFKRIYEGVCSLGLGYLSLNRPLNTLSGGEKQRLILLNYMGKNLENTLFVFENPSFGLSKVELVSLSNLMHRLVDFGHTVVVIDNNSFWKNQTDFELKF